VFYESLAAVKKNGMATDRACRVMPVSIATLALAIFCHTIFAHDFINAILILNSF
jgi:hypothetical protein